MLEGATRRSYRFPILAAIAVAAVAFLVWRSTSANSAYALTVGELVDRGAAAHGERVRVMGRVLPGSIDRGPRVLRFTAVDQTGRIDVSYDGVVPDVFKDDVDVVLEGAYGADGVFVADTLLAKCPSKFEAEADRMVGEAAL